MASIISLFFLFGGSTGHDWDLWKPHGACKLRQWKATYRALGLQKISREDAGVRITLTPSLATPDPRLCAVLLLPPVELGLATPDSWEIKEQQSLLLQFRGAATSALPPTPS